jgi:SnoaL-like protein
LCDMTEAERAVVASAVQQAWADMMAGARALDPDRVRAGYVDRPTVAINGRVIEDFDRDQFAEVRRWFSSLSRFEADYDQVHLEVLSPSAAVATMYHHLRWWDTAGTVGEWNSAWTAVFQQVGGRWRIVYSHESVPLPTSN